MKQRVMRLLCPVFAVLMLTGAVGCASKPETDVDAQPASGTVATDTPSTEEPPKSAPADSLYRGPFGTKMYYSKEQTAESFHEHCAALEYEGYTRVFSNRIGDNEYASFRREGETVYTYFTAYASEIRTINDTVSTLTLPAEEQQYDKLTETSVIQLAPDFYNDGSWGMGYLIQLEDSRYVVIDGGYEGNGTNANRILGLMESMNRREDKKIVIAAWILTHDHPDHYSVFFDFARRLADRVTLEQVIVNTQGRSDRGYLATKDFRADIRRFGENVPLWIAQVGQVFYLADARFEILNTAFSVFPGQPNINGTSLVFRMTAEGQSFLWTGDIELETGEIVCRSFGDYLKSDILQMPHHGYYENCVAEEFYATVDPIVLFWDTIQPNADDWYSKAETVRYAVDSLHVQETHVADNKFTRIAFPYTVGAAEVLSVE